MKLIFITSILIFCNCMFAQLLSPEQFLPTQYKKGLTPYHLLVDYLKHASENSDKIKIEFIGYTNEDRPQYVCYISSPQNLAQLENIRLTNLYNIGLVDSRPSNSIEKVIIWLSYGVHGNEPACSESSISVIYELINGNNPKAKEWLDKSLIIINPALNPDGYSRYTSWNKSISSNYINPERDHVEHTEPWPEGRVSHYLFDLNRDWAWQTQKESRNFISIYNKWMPHIHADIHEMGVNAPYYFAPAAEPIHKYITKHQRDFQVEIGKNNAKYFDENGWLYFTREIFDLYYPSYGDTYPTYNGAIGMTYEKGGIDGGRAIILDNGDTLSIEERILEHKMASLSTIEISANNANLLIDHFKKFFSESSKNPKGRFKTYVLKSSPKAERLIRVLDANGIKYQYADEVKKFSGYHYQSDAVKSFETAKGDLIISALQPKSVMTQMLLELNHELVDSNTYDITSWSLPLLYNIETYGIAENLSLKTKPLVDKVENLSCSGKQYAYILPWNSINSIQTLANLYKNNFVVRMAKSDVNIPSGKIARGSIIITKGDNPNKKNFDDDVKKILKDKNDCQCINSGLASNGGDLGGGSYKLLVKPKVLSITGEGTSNLEVGQVWHYFDEVLNYPFTRVDFKSLDNVQLHNYNTLVLPDGGYNLNANTIDKIKSWVTEGGRLIVIGGALDIFSGKEGFALNKYATEEEKEQAKKDKEARELAARKDKYRDYVRKELSDFIPGAIIENTVDTSHPITFGLGEKYFSLKTSTQYYKLLKGVDNPIYTPNNYRSYGFIGSKIRPMLNESINVSTEKIGSGSVIYMVDNPLFRGFVENGNILFGNAIFLGF